MYRFFVAALGLLLLAACSSKSESKKGEEIRLHDVNNLGNTKDSLWNAVIRFNNEEVFDNPEFVAEQIKNALDNMPDAEFL